MAATATQVILDTPAAEFRLPATDGKTYALDDVAGEKGTVVVFICNHCPYVTLVGNGAQQIEQILRRPRQAIQAGNNGQARPLRGPRRP